MRTCLVLLNSSFVLFFLSKCFLALAFSPPSLIRHLGGSKSCSDRSILRTTTLFSSPSSSARRAERHNSNDKGKKVETRLYSTAEEATSKTNTADNDAVDDLSLDDGEWKMINDLWKRSLSKDSDNVCDEKLLEEILVKTLPTMNPRFIYILRRRNAEQPTTSTTIDEEDENKLNIISKILDNVVNSQLENARNVLSTFLNSGEVRKLDSEIGKAAKNGQLDMSFFTVLNMNMQDAQQEELALQTTTSDDNSNDDDNKSGDEDDTNNNTNASRLQILQHIYTRCQEEVEKLVPPGTALLNKLLRTEVDSIRKNQLEHYLCPQKNVITSPDGKEIELQGERPILVKPIEFINALKDAVKQIRTIEQAGATSRESAAMMVESCRQVAKEARIVIGESYGVDSTTLKEFENELMPVFRPTSSQSPYMKGD